jgi:hypothetical protein
MKVDTEIGLKLLVIDDEERNLGLIGSAARDRNFMAEAFSEVFEKSIPTASHVH